MAGILNTYGEKLKDPRWQRYRLEIMRRDDFACRLCGDRTTTLNIHHLKYSGEPWDAPAEFLWTLCADCHTIVSANKIDLITGRVSARKIPGEAFTAILLYDENGMSIYSKTLAGVAFIMGFKHSTLRFVVQDTIDYWLQTDRQQLLTDNSINQNPNPEKAE